jgi:thiamine-monophosphate kinase
VAKNEEIRRFNAKVGDSIVITGYHGLSRAGLELLFHPETGRNLNSAQKKRLIQAHQRPRPRLDCIPHLQKIVKQFPIAGMDSSDGLADAIIQICRCSEVGAEIERIPLHPTLKEYVGAEKALEWALYGGEDFELVLCLPPDDARELLEKVGSGGAIIGQIVPGREIKLADGRNLSLSSGFQHF